MTWKSAQKMCKRWLEAGLPQFRTQADSIKNCLDLEQVITCLITKKGLPKTGGRSALQISLERTSSLAVISRRDELIIRLGMFPSKAKTGHN